MSAIILAFIGGLFIGGIAGILIMGLCAISAKDDEIRGDR